MADSPDRRMVLLVDPHEDHRGLHGDWFWSQGFDVVTTSSGRRAIAVVVPRYGGNVICERARLQNVSTTREDSRGLERR